MGGFGNIPSHIILRSLCYLLLKKFIRFSVSRLERDERLQPVEALVSDGLLVWR